MKKIYIIDVRSKEEYEDGFKENAINLPIEDLYYNTELSKNILNNISKDNDEIRVYCFSGSRAEIAKNILNNMGYKHVINLGGLK